MRFREIARALLSHAAKFLDTDGDGRVEIADLPGALAKAASLQASGVALISAGKASYDSIRAVAQAGALTSDGKAITVADVDAAWEAAKVPYRTAAAEARAEIGQ